MITFKGRTFDSWPSAALWPITWRLRWLQRHVLHELAARWHCRRYGVVRIAESIRIHSFKVCGDEKLIGAIPGAIFADGAPQRRLGIGFNVLQTVSLEVENKSRNVVPFYATICMHLTGQNRGALLHFPMTLIPPGQQRIVEVNTQSRGIIDQLRIPTYGRMPQDTL